MTNPAIRFIRPSDLTTVAPYAYASVITAPGLIFTAGACPLDADGRIVAGGDVRGQAQQVMSNLWSALQVAKAGPSDVLKTTVYVASSRREDLSVAWAVVRDAFGDHDAPSTLIGVSVLGYEDQLVEVEAIALLPSNPDE